MPSSFAQWGIDLLRRFQINTGWRTQIIVAINYFTKWIKVKALALTTEFHVIKFLKANICF